MTAARVAAYIGAAAYAGVLATTRPFTLSADVVTALALAVAAGALVFRLRADRHTRTARPAPGPVTPGGLGSTAGAPSTGVVGSPIPWVVLVAVVVGWELYCFFGGPRPAHPTLSSVYDIVARWPAAKAAVVLAWLALGWGLVR